MGLGISHQGKQAEEALGRINDALTDLHSVPLDQLTDTEVLVLTVEIENLARRVFTAQLQATGQLDHRRLAQQHGSKRTAQFLPNLLHISPADAAARIRTLTATTSTRQPTGALTPPMFPRLAAALEAGTISPDSADVIVQYLRQIPIDIDSPTRDLAEKAMVDEAAQSNPAVLRRLGKEIIIRLDPDGKLAKEATKRAGLSIGNRRHDGLTKLTGYLDDLTIERLREALEPLAAPLPATGGIPDQRSAANRRAQGLSELLNRYLRMGTGPAHGGVLPQVTVYMTVEDLLGEAPENWICRTCGEPGIPTHDSDDYEDSIAEDLAADGPCDSSSGGNAPGPVMNNGPSAGPAHSGGAPDPGPSPGPGPSPSPDSVDRSTTTPSPLPSDPPPGGRSGPCFNDGTSLPETGSTMPQDCALDRDSNTPPETDGHSRNTPSDSGGRDQPRPAMSADNAYAQATVTRINGRGQQTRRPASSAPGAARPGPRLRYGGAADPGTARRLACGAEIIPFVLDSSGLPLDVGRAARGFTLGIRRAIEAMYDTCAFPGCTTPIPWCDLHHVIPWAQGGPTSLENCAPLCDHHHDLIHQGAWTMRIADDGFAEFLPPPWIDPTGTRLRQIRRLTLHTGIPTG